MLENSVEFEKNPMYMHAYTYAYVCIWIRKDSDKEVMRKGAVTKIVRIIL